MHAKAGEARVHSATACCAGATVRAARTGSRVCRYANDDANNANDNGVGSCCVMYTTVELFT